MKQILSHPLGVVGAYLLAVTPALLVGPWGVARAGLAVVHVAAVAACLAVAARRGEVSWVVGWIPLLALPFLYWEIPFLNQGLAPGYRDGVVVAWEAAVFGSPATTLAGRFPSTLLSESLHLAYLAYYPVIYVPPLILFFQRRRTDFVTASAALVASAVACYAVYTYFPVQGPRYFGPPEGVPSGPVRGLTLSILEAGSSRGAAFPSSHMAITAAQAVVTLYFLPRLGVVVSVIALGLGVGAVYGGFHYGIDMVVGLLVGAGVAWAVIRRRRADAPEDGGDGEEDVGSHPAPGPGAPA